MALGVDAEVGGALLYVDDAATELHALPAYWQARAGPVLAAIAATTTR